jgi:hypothetical protein
MNRVTVLSLGAGVQSTTMLLMACHGLIERPDYVIFADTGWEPEPVYDHLEWLEKEAAKHGLEITTVRNGNIKEDVKQHVDTGERAASLPYHLKADDGSEGFNGRQCTSEYKIQPIRKDIRKQLGYEPRQKIREKVIMMKGISLDEYQRMSISNVKWIEHSYPLIDQNMDRQSCYVWLEKNGYSIPPKSSCIGCPFHNNELWRDMKRNDPQSWEDAVQFDKKIRHQPKLRSEAYLHRDRVPLDQVDLNENQTELDLFNNECGGYCGV